MGELVDKVCQRAENDTSRDAVEDDATVVTGWLNNKQTCRVRIKPMHANHDTTTTTTTVQRIESMINDEKGMTNVILMILRRPTMDNRVRETSKSIQQALCENFELDASNLNTQQYALITKHIDRLKLLPPGQLSLQESSQEIKK